MRRKSPTARDGALLAVLLVYGSATLLHHAHNAEFLNEYPNMPVWLSPARVYVAWLGVTAVGLAGYWLIRKRYEVAGLIVLGVYALCGFGGLDHYAVAPMSAHTATMNFTIWFEVVAAAALLMVISAAVLGRLRKDRRVAQA